MRATPKLAVLVIGRHDAAEMRAVAGIEDVARGAECRFAATAAEALEMLRGADWFPDLVLVCQRWSDEFTPSEVRELFSRLPVARWVVCLGAWCESDGRTRSIWPRAVCVPSRAAGGRLRAELEIIAGLRAPLPLTASRDEAALFEADGACERGDGSRVAVISADREFRRSLREWIVTCGWRSAADAADADVILYDLDPLSERSLAAAERAASSLAAPVVGVATLAHPEDLDRLAAAGVREVVPKLAAAAHLSLVLPRVLAGVSSPRPTSGTGRRAGS